MKWVRWDNWVLFFGLGVVLVFTIGILAALLSEPEPEEIAPMPTPTGDYSNKSIQAAIAEYSSSQQVPKSKVTPAPVSTPTTDPNRLVEANLLWDRLQAMRNDPEFLKCGYGAGCGPGAQWASDLEKLDEKTDALKFYDEYGFFLSHTLTDMWMLGSSYMFGEPGEPAIEFRVRQNLRR